MDNSFATGAAEVVSCRPYNLTGNISMAHRRQLRI
jgi:hypothetical protein